MNYNEQRTQQLEYIIRDFLTKKRMLHSVDYTIPILLLYEYVTSYQIPAYKGTCPAFPALPTGTFNKIIGDMKKAGIIGTAKGGEIVFLSDAARDLYLKKLTAPVNSTTFSTEVKS